MICKNVKAFFTGRQEVDNRSGRRTAETGKENSCITAAFVGKPPCTLSEKNSPLSWRSVIKLCDIAHPPDNLRQAAFRVKRHDGNEVAV